MQKEKLTLALVRAAGLPAHQLVTDDDECVKLYQRFADGKDGVLVDTCVTIAGEELNAVTTDKHVFVFYQQYALNEDGTEDFDEVDLFMVNIYVKYQQVQAVDLVVGNTFVLTTIAGKQRITITDVHHTDGVVLVNNKHRIAPATWVDMQ